MAIQYKITDKWRTFLPDKTPEEKSLLEESILRDKRIRESGTVWKETKELIDGFNRHDISQKHQMVFRVEERSFDSEESAQLWVLQNQLERRNLTQGQKTLILGELARLKIKAQEKVSVREKENVAKSLAKTHGVSERTVRRAAEAAEATKNLSIQAKTLIEAGAVEATPSQIVKLAELPPTDQLTVVGGVQSGRFTDMKSALKSFAAPPEEELIDCDDSVLAESEAIANQSQPVEEKVKPTDKIPSGKTTVAGLDAVIERDIVQLLKKMDQRKDVTGDTDAYREVLAAIRRVDATFKRWKQEGIKQK